MPFPRPSISAAELRLAVRLLRRQPVVTLTTVLALAVGIGMATTGFTLLDSVLFSKLPYPNGDRFVLVEVHTEPEAQRSTVEAERFRFFRERASTFEHLGAIRDNEVNLLLPSGEILPVPGALITPSSIAVFPYAPVVGRKLTAADGVPGAPPVALLRESLWRRHFSGDPRAVGSLVEMSGVRRMIVGVMPDDFKFPNSGEIWLPLHDDGDRAAVDLRRAAPRGRCRRRQRRALRAFAAVRGSVSSSAATPPGRPSVHRRVIARARASFRCTRRCARPGAARNFRQHRKSRARTNAGEIAGARGQHRARRNAQPAGEPDLLRGASSRRGRRSCWAYRVTGGTHVDANDDHRYAVLGGLHRKPSNHPLRRRRHASVRRGGGRRAGTQGDQPRHGGNAGRRRPRHVRCFRLDQWIHDCGAGGAYRSRCSTARS